MSDAAINAESSAVDPLRTAADAMAIAVRAAKDGASDAQARVSEAMPAIGQFLSRFTYTTCYVISYGIVFPSLLVARSVPRENVFVHGLIDGGRAACDAVAGMGKTPDLEATDGAAAETPGAVHGAAAPVQPS